MCTKRMLNSKNQQRAALAFEFVRCEANNSSESHPDTHHEQRVLVLKFSDMGSVVFLQCSICQNIFTSWVLLKILCHASFELVERDMAIFILVPEIGDLVNLKPV